MDKKPNRVEDNIKISIVIPLYNEEKNVPLLYDELKTVLDEIGLKYEIIFIDDGSTDGTFKILEKTTKKDKNVKIIKFRKNFGQTAAIYAGFKHSVGEIIITMDGDLQNNPKDIPKLIEMLKENDVVSGWRYNRKDPLTKKIPSKISNFLASKLTGLRLHDFGCTLKAYKREAIKNLHLYGEMHRYIPAIVAGRGFKIGEIPVDHRERKFGKSKYGVKRLIKGFLDLIYIKFWLDFSTRPLHFFGILGAFHIFVGFILATYKVIYKHFIMRIPLEVGPLLLLTVMLIIVGLLLIVFGFLSEILIRTYYESTETNPYEIEKIVEGEA